MSSPPPSKKFILKPSALVVGKSSTETPKEDKPADVQQDQSKDNAVKPIKEADSSKNVLLRPSLLVVNAQSNNEVKLDEEKDKQPESTLKFAPLTPPKDSTSPVPVGSPLPSTTTSESNGDNVPEVNGHKNGIDAVKKPFVFGEKLEDRVIITEKSKNEPVPAANDALTEVASPDGQSQAKRKYEAITGEEDELNVLQIHCKLYQWETEESIWREKGKGFLKLNDKMKDDKLCSRLVMRTAGSLKVILNSCLVVGMSFSLSNETSLRFTNVDGIYTVKGKEKDIEQLHSAVEYRLRELSKKMKCEEEDRIKSGESVPRASQSDEQDADESRSCSGSAEETGGNESETSGKQTPHLTDSTKEESFKSGCFNTIRNQSNLDDLSN